MTAFPRLRPTSPSSPSGTSTSSPPGASRPDDPAPGGGSRVSTWWRRDARFDLPASLVVFLVAVPLSLGIAVASGAPVAAGLIAAIIGGIVAGMLGGSPLTVSGPAAGLTVVVAETVAQFGWRTTCLITACAGLVQLVLGVSRVGRFALAISPTVVHGMLAGIGLSILLGQANVALGGTSQPSAWANLAELPSSLVGVDGQAAACAALVIVLLLLWPRLPQRLRVVPGPLVAVVAVTVVAAVALPGAARVDLGGSLLDQIGLPQMPDVSWLAFAGAVLTITMIASVESLLSAVAVDKLHGGTRSDLDRELLGQGAANSLSGLLGGLPVTGVIVRSATNVAAGARTRASAVLHGVWVLVFALLLSALVQQIPLAVLAGLLMIMGIGLVKPADLREAHQRGEAWIYVVTVVLVLALNLVEGVLIGLACALLVVLYRVASVKVTTSARGCAPDGRELWVVEVHGTLSFLAAPRLVRGLDAVPAGQVVEVDLLVDYADAASEEQLQEWRTRYEAAGGLVVVQRPTHEAQPDRPSTVKIAPLTARSFLPWSSWLADSESPTTRLAEGIREYHRRSTPALEEVYDSLRDGQQPDSFFLSCVDSRVVPNLVTSSGPGDLFTVRTMGNLVPPAGSGDASVSAPLHYALDTLGVPTVVVCGHSGCGAMNYLLTTEGQDGLTGDDPVSTWMAHAGDVVQAWRAGHPVGQAAQAQGEAESDQLSQVGVALALDLLRVEAGRSRHDVLFIGLWLRVSDGTVHMLRDDRFVPLTDAELLELAPLM